MLFCIVLTLSWMDAVACNASFVYLTGEEIAADVVKASALQEGSYNEVHESQKNLQIGRNFLALQEMVLM